MKWFREDKGFTILELMTTLVLFGLVVVGGFRLYYFADRAFSQGSQYSDLLAEMDYAMRKITEEVRLAHSLTIGASRNGFHVPPSQPGKDVGRYFIYSDSEQGSIVLETPEGERPLISGQTLGTTYQVTFKLGMGDGETPIPGLLAISLESQNPELKHSLESEIQVLNLRNMGIAGDVDEGQAVMFTKTFTPEELDAVAKLVPGCFLGQYIYASDSRELNALRQFRDNTLAVTPWGRFLVKAYYSVSPVLISFVERYPWAKAPVVKIFETAAQLVLRFS
jgi:prepilin-type N-terminal cleavage/methylation domain-containing protein